MLWRSAPALISICITTQNRSRVPSPKGVLELLPNCVRSLVATGDRRLELVIADFKSTDWPLREWLPQAAAPLPVTLLDLPGWFSRGRGLNAAAAAARGSILFFCDADMLVPRLVLDDCRLYCPRGQVFVPTCRDVLEDGGMGTCRTLGFGNFAVSRRLFARLGPWPEFESWGGEDTILRERAGRVCRQGIVRYPVPGFLHQWHPSGGQYRNPAASEYDEYQRREHARRERWRKGWRGWLKRWTVGIN